MSEHVDDKLLMAHEYDGIKELDNSLPRWWLYGFYFTIVFGFVYLIYYHVSGIGPSADQEYLREMADAGYRVPRAWVADLLSATQSRIVVIVGFLCAALVLVVEEVIRIDRESLRGQ